ncbi:serine protease [Niabella sp. CJ426]|uniref:serine protease n=1 Tax=Niabella sp. CJ426 TaxID=3393740 RepID=UPI003D079036
MKKLLLPFVLALLILNGCQKKETVIEKDPTPKEIEKKSVINGSPITINARPYQVAIFINGNFNGGGIILNNNWILTAKHVVAGVNASQVTVIAGTTDLGASPSTRQNRTADNLVPNGNSDLTLIHLSTPLSYSYAVSQVEYSFNEPLSLNQTVTVSGWGFQDYRGGTLSTNTLRSADLKVTDLSDPSLIYCGASGSPHQAACGGDSGGPLTIVNSAGKAVVVGVVSFGSQYCATPPDGYVRVSQFADWIYQTTGILHAGIEVNGADVACAPSTYSVSNLPANTNLNWEVVPSWAATVSASGNTVTISPGAYNNAGGFLLKANILNGTQVIGVRQKRIELNCSTAPAIAYIPNESSFSLPLAKVTNASLSEVAYLGYQSNNVFGWSSPVDFSFTIIPGMPITGVDRYCSDMVEQIGVIQTGWLTLNPNKQYVATYWEKDCPLEFTGYGNTGTIISNQIIRTSGDWNLRKVIFTGINGSDLTVLLDVTGYIQELRLYPVGASMETYTYDANGNMKTKCDNDYNMSYY